MARRDGASARDVSLLDDILASKRREIEALRAEEEARLQSKESTPTTARAAIDVVRALRRPKGAPLRLIAEVKRKSPSAGALSRVLTCAERASAYAAGGASMISVLCDAPFFDGGWHHLAEARAALDRDGHRVPLLAKEFVLDEAQVRRARKSGADAVLLIARILSKERLRALARAAMDEGLEPFVEVIDEQELENALAGGARVVGVNARDLDTLAMDAARAARVLEAIPEDRVVVHLSGLKGQADVSGVARGRADAALMGEALMRQDDPSALLASLVRAARGCAPT